MAMSQNKAVITIDGKYIGTQTDLTFAYQTDIRPQYTINTIDPKSFSEGISMVSGIINFALIDTTILLKLNPNGIKKRYSFADTIVNEWNDSTPNHKIIDDTLGELVEIKNLDELPPVVLNIFNIEKTPQGPEIAQMILSDVEFTAYRLVVNVNDVIAMESVEFIGLDYNSKYIKE